MKTMKFYFLVLILLGFSVSGICQLVEKEGKDLSHSELLDIKHQIFKNIGVSVNVVDDWHVKKQEKDAIVSFKDQNSDSNFSIEINDLNSMLDSIWVDKDKGDIYLQKIRVLLNDLNTKGNGSSDPNIKISLQRPISKQMGNKELITIYKVINNKGFLIQASIDNKCVDCNNEFNFMIKSMQDAD